MKKGFPQKKIIQKREGFCIENFFYWGSSLKRGKVEWDGEMGSEWVIGKEIFMKDEKATAVNINKFYIYTVISFIFNYYYYYYCEDENHEAK